MQKAIVTTTINPPTEAIEKFISIAERDDWRIFVAGDLKTPGDEYVKLARKYGPSRICYLAPKDQERMSQDLSDIIGWNCIQRRNFAILAAYQWGADIVAMVDDDNIPYEYWGTQLHVGLDLHVDLYDTPGSVFNPLGRHDFGYQLIKMCSDPLAAYESLWHRGVPVQDLGNTGIELKRPQGSELRRVLVQADMWDGDPDIDAIARIALHPEVKFTHQFPYAGARMGPFNSQNTFIHRSVVRDYFLFPHIGRMDDIWASYVMQTLNPNSVIYGTATVYQRRNEHDLSKDLQAEMLGYRHSNELVAWLQTHNPAIDEWPGFMPRKSLAAFELWRNLTKEPSCLLF